MELEDYKHGTNGKWQREEFGLDFMSSEIGTLIYGHFSFPLHRRLLSPQSISYFT
jgi:hypothetical protein